MSAARKVVAAIARLFVDDGNLAIWVALILAAFAFVASTPWCKAPCVGPLFVAAVVAALLASVWRSSR
jgi:hypothetical protein